tara:strand:+ start:455 stop:622 length:168 start_codon:yes stop_codon:yes gene_type:complete
VSELFDIYGNGRAKSARPRIVSGMVPVRPRLDDPVTYGVADHQLGDPLAVRFFDF